MDRDRCNNNLQYFLTGIFILIAGVVCIMCSCIEVHAEEIQLFGTDQSFRNKTHYTPDYSVLLNKGIGGILAECRQRSERTDTTQQQKEFLSSVMIAYQGLMTLIRRYSEKAAEMSENAHGTEKIRLTEIASVCKNILFPPYVVATHGGFAKI